MKLIIVENPRPLTMEHYNDVANAPLSSSLNSGYALTVARQAGWDTAHLDFTGHAGEPVEMAERILLENGDLILFHWVYSWGHEELVRDTLELLRRESMTPTGCFGLFPTLGGQRLLYYAPQLDFILIGEFEATLADLLRDFTVNSPVVAVPGIAGRDQHFVARPLIDDLSMLPIPDDVGCNLTFPTLNIAASRGCHGHCSFCFIHRYYGCNRRRTRSVSSLEQELKTRLARRSIDSLYFIDPSFIGQGNGERERILEIGQLAHSLGLPFGFETRVDSVDADVLSRLAGNGARSIFLGIESGCDAVLQRIGKRITKRQARQAVQTVQESGLQLLLGFIMFEPDTTLDELAENYQFLEELGLLNDHELTANLLYHNQIVLYGSAAWGHFEKAGRLMVDPGLPFEARYRFRDNRAGQVCSAMGQLTAAYFMAMNSVRRSGAFADTPCCTAKTVSITAANNLNLLLKNAFIAFCSAAENRQPHYLKDLGKRFLQELQIILPVQ